MIRVRGRCGGQYIVVLLEKLGSFGCRFCSLRFEANNAGVVDCEMNFAWCCHIVVGMMLLLLENVGWNVPWRTVSLSCIEHFSWESRDLYIEGKKAQAWSTISELQLSSDDARVFSVLPICLPFRRIAAFRGVTCVLAVEVPQGRDVRLVSKSRSMLPGPRGKRSLI